MREEQSYSPPEEALDTLSRCLYPVVTAYFESEEGRCAFAEWQRWQEEERALMAAEVKEMDRRSA